MKNYLYPLFLATALTTVACSADDKVTNFIEEETPADQKEAIAFTASDLGASNQGNQTRAGFTNTTQIVARFESTKSNEDGTLSMEKRTTRTVLTASVSTGPAEADYSTVTYATASNGNAEYIRYWDDAYGRYANISVYAVAVPQKTGQYNNGSSLVDLINYGGVNASNSNTIWKKDEDTSVSNNNITWVVNTTEQTSITIDNEDLCYSNNIQEEGDGKLGKDGRYVYNFDHGKYLPEKTGLSKHSDGQLKIALKTKTDKTSAGKFDQGHLVFKHALTRLTINLKRGAGFSTGAGYFNFDNVGTDESNVKVKNVPVKNTLDIKTGLWSTTPTDIKSQDIEKIYKLSEPLKNGFDYSLMAQFIPGYTFAQNSNTNVLEFSIDGNTYYITQQMVWKALNDNASVKDSEGNVTDVKNGLDKSATSYTMEQGKNYILDITVKKTGIENVTATLIEWGKVQADNVDATNAYITISAETMGPQTTKCNHFDLYRLDAGVTGIYTNQNNVDIPKMYNWEGNYTDRAVFKDGSPSSDGIWQTTWFWDSNKSFYHFRTVDKGVVINGANGDGADATDDYFNIYSGPVNNTWAETTVSTAVNDKKYNDYHWGAPMKKDASLTYIATENTETVKKEGYSENLYQAIGSTTDKINIIEQHMMSTVHFIIHTGTKANGNDVSSSKVSLLDSEKNATRVTLTKFYGEGKVKMGNGFITPSGSIIDSEIPVPGIAPVYGTSGDVLNKLVSDSWKPTTGYFETDGEVTNPYDYRVVPQVLYRGSVNDPSADNTLSNFVGLTIVTPDNNQYYVIKKLYGVEGTISGNGNKNEHNANSETHKAEITRWYPGYDYTYHIYINKTGIENITCTVVDWVKVEGNVGDISLED